MAQKIMPKSMWLKYKGGTFLAGVDTAFETWLQIPVHLVPSKKLFLSLEVAVRNEQDNNTYYSFQSQTYEQVEALLTIEKPYESKQCTYFWFFVLFIALFLLKNDQLASTSQATVFGFENKSKIWFFFKLAPCSAISSEVSIILIKK